LNGARVHSRGAGNEFRPHGDFDGSVHLVAERRIDVAREAYGDCPDVVRFVDGSQDVWGTTARGDAHDAVARGDGETLHRLDATGVVILGVLDGHAEGGCPAREDTHDLPVLDVERRSRFGGVEHAEASRGARPDVDAATAAFHVRHDVRDRVHDLWLYRDQGVGKLSNVGTHDVNQIGDGQLVKVRQFVAYLLGAQLFQELRVVRFHQAAHFAMVAWMVARSSS
jgi:hypothetical protein